MTKGSLFIVSAPSGTGKTTILKKIMRDLPGISFSVSHTTRPPRAGEQDGVDYHFISRDDFVRMKDDGAFLEWAEVHGNLYGTSRKAVEEQLSAGKDLLLDIDVQGARQIRQAMNGDAVFLFIAPPSWQILEDRLSGRGTDAPETIRLRLDNARKEMEDAALYEYVVINDDLDMAVDMVRSIIVTERCRNRRGLTGEPMPLPGLRA